MIHLLKLWVNQIAPSQALTLNNNLALISNLAASNNLDSRTTPLPLTTITMVLIRIHLAIKDSMLILQVGLVSKITWGYQTKTIS